MRYYKDDEVRDDIIFCQEDYFKDSKKRESSKGQALIKKFEDDPNWQENLLEDTEN